jgi:ankyrin repeat protein
VSTPDNLRKAAKRWLKAIREGDAQARARLIRAHPTAPAEPTLRDLQHALARERGHENWTALLQSASTTSEHDPALTDLLESAGKGNAERVAAILDAHPHLVNRRGTLPGNTGLRTALHFGSGHESVVRTLLARGADPNIRDEGDNAYPLHFAAERGDLPIVTLLVEHGADPIGAGTTHELDALGWAVCFDYAMHVDVARYLLAHGARHTVHSAVAMGDADAIRALADAGADLNQRMDGTNKRRTPLHLAAVKKQPAAAAALIDLGADMNATDAVGLTPLDQASLDGQDEMTRLLLDRGARITLPAAIALDRTEDVERLVREDPDTLSTTSNRPWARLLVHAAGRAPGRVVEALLRTVMRHRSGLSIVNMEDDLDTAVDGASGYTPLHAAAFAGNIEAIEILLKHGANPRTRDGKYHATPAGWAAYAGHEAAVLRILEADIDIFDAIDFDRADRVLDILDRDPAALERPYKAYARDASAEDPSTPSPNTTPLEWAKKSGKTRAAEAITSRGAGARTDDEKHREERVAQFLQSACWDHHTHGKAEHRMHDRAAQRILAGDPWIARHSVCTAIVCGELDEIRRILAERPETARLRGGAREWTPILYLAYTRFTASSQPAHKGPAYPPLLHVEPASPGQPAHKGPAYPPLLHVEPASPGQPAHEGPAYPAVEIARLLLDHGADPNDFYMAGDARYSVLTGIAGEGEQDSPRQPYAAALFDLLLERGAEPFDIQVLYNTHFSGDMLWWLELVHARTIDTPRGAAWSDPEWTMFDMGGYGTGARFVLETAVKKGLLDLARWALERGANPNAGHARDRRFPAPHAVPARVAERQPEIADLLARHGASTAGADLDDGDRFIDACFQLDRAEAARLLAAHPEYLQDPRALFEAAKRDRADVLALLLDLGFTPDMQRSPPTSARCTRRRHTTRLTPRSSSSTAAPKSIPLSRRTARRRSAGRRTAIASASCICWRATRARSGRCASAATWTASGRSSPKTPLARA